MRGFLLVSVLVALLLTAVPPHLIHAVCDPIFGCLGEGFIQDILPARDLPTTIRFIVNFALGLVGILALAVLVYGGFRYVVSRGEENEIEVAKGIITNAVIGLIVIGIAAAIVNFVIGAVLTPTVEIRGTLPGPT